MRRWGLLALGFAVLTIASGAPRADADVVDAAAEPFAAAGTIFGFEFVGDRTVGTALSLKPVTSTSNNVAGHVLNGGLKVRLTPATQFFRRYTVGGYAEPASFEEVVRKGRTAKVKGRLVPLPTSVGQDVPVAESVTALAPQTSASLDSTVLLTSRICGDSTECVSSGPVVHGDLAGWTLSIDAYCLIDPYFFNPTYHVLKAGFTLTNGKGDSISQGRKGASSPSEIEFRNLVGTGRFAGIDTSQSEATLRVTELNPLATQCLTGQTAEISLDLVIP